MAEYEAGPYKGFADDVLKGFSSIVPPDANVEGVADAIVKVVDAPFGQRPFRVRYDPDARRGGSGQYGFGSRPCRAFVGSA